jgi:hypothetical protein
MTDSNQPTRDQLVDILVQQAAIASTGTFSQRNPILGKMIRCPYCEQRRRQNETCCNPEYIATVKNDVPRSFYAKKRQIPRLSRNRPPLLLIHQCLVELESQPGYVEQEGISGIVEAQIKRERKSAARIKRKQQRKSRKINRSNV